MCRKGRRIWRDSDMHMEEAVLCEQDDDSEPFETNSENKMLALLPETTLHYQP